MQRVGEASSSPGAVDSAFSATMTTLETAESDMSCCATIFFFFFLKDKDKTQEGDHEQRGKLFFGASPCHSVPHVSHFESFNSI